MRTDHEAILAELSHPDPLQSILAAVYWLNEARMDVMAFKLFLDCAKEAGMKGAR